MADELVKTEPGEEDGHVDSDDELQRLKKVRSGLKSAFTRKFNHIRELMADPQMVDEVFKVHSSLADIWAKFNHQHRQIMTHVASDEIATQEHSTYYEKEQRRMVEFDKTCTEWIDKSRTTLEDEIKPEDSASQTSSRRSNRSDRSSILKAAYEEKAKRQVAEVRLKFLEEEENLKRQLNLLAAKKELEECKTREESWMEAAREACIISGKSSHRNKATDKPLQPLYSSSHSTAEDIIKQASAAFFLPRQEVPTFTGDPLDYNNFSIAFKTLIEDKTTCASSRLFYLAQYTSGDVKELVKSCFSMDPEKGYQEALRLLKTRYGHSFRIATAYVDRIVKGAMIKSEDTVGLQKFSVQLTSCCNTLKQCGHLNKVENPESFRAIVAKLPFELRRKWRSRADFITEEEDRDIKFEDFVRFIEKEVRLVSHPLFGNLFTEGEKKQDTSKDKAKSFATTAIQEKENTAPSNNNSYTRESSYNAPKSPSCILCSGAHHLSGCPEFRNMPLDDRYSHVQKLGICFNCLHKHLVKDCQTKQRCRVCGGKHFTLLHRYTVENSNPNYALQQANASENPATATSATPMTGTVGAAVSRPAQSISLQVIPVKVQAWDGTWISTNAFLDNGSNMTFCSKALIDSIGIQGRSTTVQVTTLDRKDTVIEGQLFSLHIKDSKDGQFVTQLPSVLCRPDLPVSHRDKATQRDLDQWRHLDGINLLQEDAPVGLLIGNDNAGLLQPLEVRRCQDEGPYAVRTVLGWVVNGPLGSRLDHEVGTCNLIKASLIEEQIELNTSTSDCWPKLCVHKESLTTHNPKVENASTAAIVSIARILEKFPSWCVLLLYIVGLLLGVVWLWQSTPSHPLLFHADCCELPLASTFDASYGRRWTSVQHLASDLWRHWLQSYQPLLQKRTFAGRDRLIHQVQAPKKNEHFRR